jgi:hypothetical protein
MTITGFIILLVLITIVVLAFIELAGMPGREAKRRNHPEAEAINMLGWLGLPLGGFGWLLAMVWSRTSISRIAIVESTNELPADEEN